MKRRKIKMKIAKCGDTIPKHWEWYDDYDNWCAICYEPIIKEKYTCLLCAENRVKDGLWKQAEMNDRMYGLGDEQ